MTPVVMRCLRFAGVTALAVLFTACGPDSATAPATSAVPSTKATELVPVPGRYVVIMEEGRRSGLQAATAAMAQHREVSLPELGIAFMRGITPAQAASLAETPGVADVVQDMSAQWLLPGGFQVMSEAVAEGTNQSGAAFFGFQWNVQVVQAPSAWAGTPGGLGRRVCVLDTGIDPTHIDLANKVDVAASRSTDVSFPGNQLPWDYNAHGTFVASQVSTNGIGIASVAPDARLCSIKVLGVTGSGSFGDIINAIHDAADVYNADVINMSLGAYVNRETPGVAQLINALQAAIDFATRKGVEVVVSAGNNGVNLDEDPRTFLAIPAQLNNTITVGATAPFQLQNFDMLTSYSAFGGRTGIDLVAPGGDLLPGGNSFDRVIGACSTFAGFGCGIGSYLVGTGTSFASPQVAGASAVLESHFGDMTPKTAHRCLTQGADVVGPFSIFGAGRLNIATSATCPQPN
jgi:subtilisin family serine protease